MKVAIVHDYLTQQGGAERVVLSMMKAFPDAPVFTSIYDPSRTFPQFKSRDIRPSSLGTLPIFRSNHRLALPFLAQAFSRRKVDADVVLCSSSGWAHGIGTPGRKIVYCYAPARWLYQTDRYLPPGRSLARCALGPMRPYLLGWDRRAAADASAYLTTSSAVAEAIRSIYGIEATILPPPHTIDASGSVEACAMDPGFMLCVSRLLPYKNVGAILEAFRILPDLRLVVVGDGPSRQQLECLAPPNVQFFRRITDRQLRWLYGHCVGVVAASFEDFGLTPLEAAAFGKPVAVLRWGGFLDTVIEGRTGVFFDQPTPSSIAAALQHLVDHPFEAGELRDHAAQYSEEQFIRRLRLFVAGVDTAGGADPAAPVVPGEGTQLP